MIAMLARMSLPLALAASLLAGTALMSAAVPLASLTRGLDVAPAGRQAAAPLWRVHDAPKGWSYPWACCSNRDCRAATGEVKETPQGYVIGATGETVPYQDKRIKHSPDGEYHWCAHQAGLDAGRTICLFVPPRSF